MKKMLVLFILLNILGTQASGQNNRCIDSIINVIKIEFAGNQQIDELNSLSKSYIRRNPDTSDSLNALILNLSELKNYTKGEAYLYKNIGGLQSHLGNIDSCIIALRRSLSLFRKIRDIEGQIRVSHNLSNRLDDNHMLDSAIFYEKWALEKSILKNDSLFVRVTGQGLGTKFRIAGKLDSAVYYITFALKYTQENSESKGNLLFALGNIFISMEDYKRAEIYLLNALKFFQSINSESTLYIIYNSIAAAKTGLYQYDSAAYYYNWSIKLSEKFNDSKLTSDLYSNIGTAYNFMQKYDTAILLATKGINLAKKHGYLFAEAMNLMTKTTAYAGLKKWKNVRTSAFEALSIFDSLKRNEMQLEIYELISEAEYQLGNHEKAFLTQKNLFKGYKEFLNNEKEKIISELETQYETEKKETEIAFLSQQASIQALEIRQKNQAIIIGIVITLLIITIILFVFKQQSSKRDKQKTELEQRFLRSQLNPHFISNALVAVQNYMLKNQTETASIYLSKFSKLMREILENSRKEFIPVEDEMDMLANYLDIHKLRMNDSFDYNIDVDENIDIETDTIPPMFIQPFVENAIEHGIINANDKGLIEINLVKDKEYISIEVKDNGSGMVKSTLKTNDHNSLSSTIIQERMALFNKTLKNKIQLIVGDIKNEQGVILGAKVELMVPFSYI